MRQRFAAGHGSYPLVGTPDHVAGTTLSFVDYVKELPYFADEVLPRLDQRGIRGATSLSAAS